MGIIWCAVSKFLLFCCIAGCLVLQLALFPAKVLLETVLKYVDHFLKVINTKQVELIANLFAPCNVSSISLSLHGMWKWWVGIMIFTIWLLLLLSGSQTGPDGLGSLEIIAIVVVLAIVLLVLGCVVFYIFRHLLSSILLGFLIAGLVMIVMRIPSCTEVVSPPSYPQKTEQTSYCWFWESCFWENDAATTASISSPRGTSYCWFWQDCFGRKDQSSHAIYLPPTTESKRPTDYYCWIWESCFWKSGQVETSPQAQVAPVIAEKVESANFPPNEYQTYLVTSGDTLWGISDGDMEKIQEIAALNANILDPHWFQNCNHRVSGEGKWCSAPKDTLQVGMSIRMPIMSSTVSSPN